MIRVIDRLNDQVVQKLVSPYGRFIGYQYGVPGQGMTACSTLTEARMAIGKLPIALLSKGDKPKLTMPSFS